MNVVMKPFNRATTAMGAPFYPTISMLSPLQAIILDMVLITKEDDIVISQNHEEMISIDLRHHYATLN